MVFKQLQKLLLPYHCVLCHEASDQAMDLCCACEADLPYMGKSVCYRCANPLSSGGDEQARICGTCLKNPPHFDSSFALCHYQDAMQQMIARLKFHQQLTYSRVLAELMIKASAGLILPDVIIPVPLHATRLHERGFNQVIEIARPLAKILNIKLDPYSCHRIRHTSPQSSLPARKRYRNIKHAFIVSAPMPAHVAIIDDVVTTGHTVNEFSRTLRRAGVQTIQIWCCARA